MQICKLFTFSVGDSKTTRFLEVVIPSNTGVLIPKDKKCYKVFIKQDNPDIDKLIIELKLTRQALQEYRKRLPYDIKVYSYGQIEEKDVDVTIEFVNQENDEFFTDNINAYGGFPNGSYRGIIRFNNSRLWLDGHNISCELAKQMGLVKNCVPTTKLLTHNYKRTIKHEFGHVIGLEHSNGVMSQFYDFDENMLGKLSLETIDEKYGLRSISSRWLLWIKSVMTRNEFK